MAGRRKRTGKKAFVRVELSGAGLVAVLTVVFCVFVWMFIFGVWTGQALLEDAPPAERGAKLAGRAAALLSGERSRPPTAGRGGKRLPPAEESFFAIQVAAFKNEDLARKEVERWRARGYDSFYLRPDSPGATFHPVFVGRFATMAKANILASKLEAGEHGKVFITLVDGGRERLPR